MSVPLDRLYNYLDSIIEDDIIIYRFFPHGSRKLEDLTMLRVYSDKDCSTNDICFICNDQEPLNYDMYSDEILSSEYANHRRLLSNNQQNWFHSRGENWINLNKQFLASYNLKLVTDPVTQFHKPCLLLHSEKKSNNLTHYENNRFIGVYWWSHAIIARDWYRFAEHDSTLDILVETPLDFLIYNRAWLGSREYRLKFAQLVVKNNLQQNCLMKFNECDSDIHYTNHTFKNTKFARSESDTKLENYFEQNTSDSTASADYQHIDYQNSLIEVVLETLVDDERHHLTEKSLRPIACGQPFMLVATAGSLKYLRSYGFQTFAPYLNEEYDTITDTLERIEAVIAEMRRISILSVTEKRKLYNILKKISNKNKKLFFSKKWQNGIIDEFKQNLNEALMLYTVSRNIPFKIPGLTKNV